MQSKCQMKEVLLCRLAALALALTCGCTVFEVGPRDREEHVVSEQTELVCARRVDGARGELTNTRSSLSLVVDGDFDTETVKEVEVRECRRGRMAFGFFPAINEGVQKADGYYVGGSRCDSRWNYIGGALIGEALLLYTPTIYSLFVEPFVSQPTSNEARLAALSLLGFYRYNAPADWCVVDRRTQRTRRAERRYEVQDYEVTYNGRRLESENGHVALPKTELQGERVRCCLESARSSLPVVQGQLDKVVGTDLVWKDTNTAWLAHLEKTYERRKPIPPPQMDKIVGKWICEQECANSQVVGLQTSSYRKCFRQHWLTRQEYEFFDDGEFQSKSLTGRAGDDKIAEGAAQKVSHGTWALDQGKIVINEHNALGAVVKLVVEPIWYSDDEWEMRFVNLRDIEKTFTALPDVLSFEMSYDDNGVVRQDSATVFCNSGKKGINRKMVMTSPRVFKRLK